MSPDRKPTFTQRAGRTALRIVPAGLGAAALASFGPSELAQTPADQPESQRQGITFMISDALAGNCKGVLAGNARNFTDLNGNRFKDSGETEGDKIGGVAAKLQPKGGKEVNVTADQAGHFEALLEGDCNPDGTIPVHVYVKAPGSDQRFVESDDKLNNNKKDTYNYWFAQSPAPTPTLSVTTTPTKVILTATPTMAATETATPLPAHTSGPTAVSAPTSTPDTLTGGRPQEIPWLPISLGALAGSILAGAWIISRRCGLNGADETIVRANQTHTFHIPNLHWDINWNGIPTITRRSANPPAAGGNPPAQAGNP